MKSIKKIAACALACVTAAMAFAGCGNTTTDNGGAAADNTAADGNKVYNVGICQLVEHVALDAATQGFKDKLTELLGEGNVVFYEQNAQGESTNCSTICQGFVSNGYDLILANATPALQAAAAATNSIPVLGTSVTDYGTALDISDWTGTTGTNISGTADLAPIDEQEKMLKELFPDVKQVGILYCSSEANSKFQAQKFGEALTADGIAYKEYSAADSNEIQSITNTAIGECDVLYVPTDNTMASNTEIIKNICVPAGIPVIAGEEGICKGCGVATLSISYYDLGVATGEMAYEILTEGKNPGEMEIRYAPNVVKEYNKEICDTLGITIPEDYVAIPAE